MNTCSAPIVSPILTYHFYQIIYLFLYHYRNRLNECQSSISSISCEIDIPYGVTILRWEQAIYKWYTVSMVIHKNTLQYTGEKNNNQMHSMEHLLNSFGNRLHCASFISKVVRKCKWYTNSSGTKPILQCCCTRSMVDFSHFYPMCMAVLHWDHLKFPSKLYHLDNLPILCEVQKLLCRLWNTNVSCYVCICTDTQIEIVYNFSSYYFPLIANYAILHLK